MAYVESVFVVLYNVQYIGQYEYQLRSFLIVYYPLFRSRSSTFSAAEAFDILMVEFGIDSDLEMNLVT